MRIPLILRSGFFSALMLAVSLSASTTLQLPDRDVSFVTINGHAEFSGAPLDADAGRPALPVYGVTFMLPPDAVPSSVKATIENLQQTDCNGTYIVAPAQPLRTRISGRQIIPEGRTLTLGKDLSVYGTSAFYPQSNVGGITTGELDGWKLCEVSIFPFQYNPVTGVLRKLTKGTLTVTYETSKALSLNRASGRQSIRTRLQKLAVNFNEGYNAFLPKSAALTTGSGVYVIITTQNIVSKSTQLAAFIADKQKRGFTVTTVTENTWGGGTGNTASDKLRAWFKSNYQSMQIEYALLIGNPDPSSGNVPMKMAQPSGEGPTDFYYCELSGNWDITNNGSFGEYRDFTTAGGADKYGEFLIGRIPVYSDADITKLDKILTKIIRYENETNISWRMNALIDMVPSDANSPMWQCGEEFKTKVCVPRAWKYFRIYDQNYNSTNPDLTPCSITNTVNAWTQNKFSINFWATHGNETLAASVIDVSNCSKLRDSFPSFTVESSCLNSHPETTNNLSTALLWNGGMGSLGCTRESIYQPGQAVFENSNSIDGICYMLAKRMIYDSMTAGKTLSETRAQTTVNNSSAWLNLLITNLYGDPSVGIYTSAMTLAFIFVTPKAGDVYNVGDNILISWQKGPVTVTNVKIEFSSNNGSTWQTVIASTANNGSYTWVAPNVASSQCLIRLSDASNAAVTVTSGAFSVYQTASVAGLVTNGKIFPTAEVQCLNAAKAVSHITLDTAGNFSIAKMIPGTYKLVAVAGNYCSDTLTVTVPPNQTGVSLEIKAPVIAANPAQIDVMVLPGGTTTTTLKINNAGKLPLQYSLTTANAGTGVIINEVYVTSVTYGQPDGYELWNRGPDIDVSGWMLDSKDNQRTSMSFTFPQGTIFKSNKTFLVTDDATTTNDSTFYIGNNLSWTFEVDTTAIAGALLDANGRCVDYFKSARSTFALPANAIWNGGGVALSNNSMYRDNNGDKNDSTDWLAAATGTYHARNPGQTSGNWSSAAWLTLNPKSGTVSQVDSAAITLSINAANLTLNSTYYDTIIVSHNAANTALPLRIAVKLGVVSTGVNYMVGKDPVFKALMQSLSGKILCAYTLPQPEKVTISLFDSKGRLLQKPVDAWQKAGDYMQPVVQGNRKMPAGVYYLRFSAGKTLCTDRVFFVR